MRAPTVKIDYSSGSNNGNAAQAAPRKGLTWPRNSAGMLSTILSMHSGRVVMSVCKQKGLQVSTTVCLNHNPAASPSLSHAESQRAGSVVLAPAGRNTETSKTQQMPAASQRFQTACRTLFGVPNSAQRGVFDPPRAQLDARQRMQE